jgi:SOS-response transcriptional repressor LexA
MSPLLRSGDWVVVSPSSPLESGCLATISERRQLQLRSYTRVGDIESFMPLNPEFADRALISDSRRERVEVVGRVLRLVNRML